MIHRYAQFWFLEKGLGIVFPPFFVHDFSRKMLLILYSINCPNFIPWLPVLLEILDNMCIATVFFKGRDVINFQTNLIFLIKLFYYYLTKKSRQKLTYLIKWEKNHRLPDCTYTDDNDSINAIILNYIAHSLTDRISSEILSVSDLRVDGRNTYQQWQCSPQNNSTLSQNTPGFICLWALHSPCCQRFDHLFAWILPFDLPGLVRPARSWSFRQYSS